MAKILQLKFKNNAGKKINLNLNYVNDNLSRETIERAMSGIAALDLFKDQDGNLIYHTPFSAKYVETTETDIL